MPKVIAEHTNCSSNCLPVSSCMVLQKQHRTPGGERKVPALIDLSFRIEIRKFLVLEITILSNFKIKCKYTKHENVLCKNEQFKNKNTG